MKPLDCQILVLCRIALGASALLTLNSCGDEDKITVYRIPKETKPDAGSQAGTAEEGGAVRWTAPSSWEEQPATGFRKASFLVRAADGKQADVSVIAFPERAGGLLPNVNRWREQLKLPPITELEQGAASLKVGGHEMFFVDLVSNDPISPDGSKARILGGILPLSGQTWFFKLTGPDQLVNSQRDVFKQFLQSVHVGEAMPLSANAGASTNAPTPPPIAPPPAAQLQYKLPPNWQEKPLSPMRLASFKATAPNGKEADVSIVSLPGVAGGDLANVNRWRGQVQLPPIDEDTLAKTAEHVRAGGHDYLLVDLVSEAVMGAQNEKQRILAAILDEDQRAWFIKMAGEDQAVASQKAAFTEFLRSLTIP